MSLRTINFVLFASAEASEEIEGTTGFLFTTTTEGAPVLVKRLVGGFTAKVDGFYEYLEYHVYVTHQLIKNIVFAKLCVPPTCLRVQWAKYEISS